MGARPTTLTLDGVTYPVYDGDGAFEVIYEPLTVDRRDSSGVNGEVVRTDFLEYNWSDWSRGEGQKWINTRRPSDPFGRDTFSLYFKSGGAVDPSTPGQVKLGLACNQETLAAAATTFTTNVAPRMITAGKPWVFYNTSAQRKSGGSWSAVTTGLTNNVTGHLAGLNAQVFVGSSTEVRRVNSSANSQWFATEGRNCLITNNYLWTIKTTSGTKFELQRNALDAAAATTSKATITGIDETVALAGDGTNVYALASVDEEKPYLFRWDGTNLVEFATLPPAFFVENNLREVMLCHNGVLFIGGYFTNVAAVDDPALLYIPTDGSPPGVVGRIRERGNNEQIKSMFPTIDNQILMGTTKGRVFAYNVNTGGFYEFASGINTADDITSMTYSKGVYYFATKNGTTGKVYATYTSGTGKYPSSVKVEGSRWDYDIPNEQKVGLEIVLDAIIPTNTSVSVSYETDDGTEQTADASGVTMTATSTGATRFNIRLKGDATTENLFRWIKPNFTLTTTDTSATPTVRGLVVRATTANKAQFFQFTLDLTDSDTPDKSVTGGFLSDSLQTLIENASNRVVALQPHYTEEDGPWPRDTDTFQVLIDDSRISYHAQGKALARLRCRVL